MSHDTQVKQEDKVPERVWLMVFEDDQDPQSTMLEWKSPVVRNTQPGDYVATRPHHKIAYVPESLLATVRREAFKEIRERIEAVNPSLTFGSANGSMMKKCILTEITALEAPATEKGEMNG